MIIQRESKREKTVRHMALSYVLSLVVLCGAVASAEAATFECTGTVVGGVIDAHIVVPAGAFCLLLGVTVNGHVSVEPGAIGFHAHTSNIRDFVMAQNPVLDIRVLDTTVGGFVKVSGTILGTFGQICRSTIGGNVELADNDGAMIVGSGGLDVCFTGLAGANTIEGNVKLFRNTGSFSVNNNTIRNNVLVFHNTGVTEVLVNNIGRNLHCEGNTPAPVSAGNMVGGNTLGQCAP